MSSKDRLITYSYKKRKRPRASTSKQANSGDIAKPSTSTDLPGSSYDADMNILKDFDLNWEYGPSMGITRMERWNRAEKHGLKPSQQVKQIIEEHSEDERYTQCLWNDYKNII